MPAARMERIISSRADLASIYRGYIDCLNRQDWAELATYVAEDVTHNGRPFGLAGYRDMLRENYRDIPDLRFDVARLVCEPPYVAACLRFDCSPRGAFLGLDVNGRRVTFTEHIFYAFENGKIKTAWSILDKGAVEACLL